MVLILVIFNLNSNFLAPHWSLARFNFLYFREKFISRYDNANATRDSNKGAYDRELVCMI